MIEFLGRADCQVKIRGFRVELGEVEGALAGVPGIKDVAVAALPDSRSELRLAAYIVGDSVPLTAELRACLKKSLPNYMIPSAFVHMEALPRTTAGKLNPRALPVSRILHFKPDRSYDAPRTPAEKFLVELWKELLYLDKVEIHDSFFDLGGESLKAFRVVARIRHALGIEIPVITLFEQPTIAELAPLIK